MKRIRVQNSVNQWRAITKTQLRSIWDIKPISSKQNHQLLVTMNSNAVNAMNPKFFTDLNETLDHIESNYSPATPVLFTNQAKSRVFSAGLDLSYLPQIWDDKSKVTEFVEGINRGFARVYFMPNPTVAVVNGHNIAGGMIMNLSCDYRVMATNPAYQTSLREVVLGISLPCAVLHLVQQQLQPAHVLYQVALLGKNFSPQELLKHGLLSDHVEYSEGMSQEQIHEQLLEKALKITDSLNTQVSADAYAQLKYDYKQRPFDNMSQVDKQAIDQRFVELLMKEETKNQIRHVLASTKK